MVNRKILILFGMSLVSVGILGFTIGTIYGDTDKEFQEKKKIVDAKILEKLELFNIGQLRAITIEYQYCVHWEDYLISIDSPITYVDKVGCLNHLEKFIDTVGE